MKKVFFMLFFISALAFQSLGFAQGQFSVSAGLGYGAGAYVQQGSQTSAGVWSGFGLGVIARVGILELAPGFSFGAMAHGSVSFGNGGSIFGGSSKSATVLALGALPTLGYQFNWFGFPQELYFGFGLGLTSGYNSGFGLEFSIGSEAMFTPAIGLFTNVTVQFTGNTMFLAGVTFKI